MAGQQPESVRCGGKSQLRGASGLRRLLGYHRPVSGCVYAEDVKSTWSGDMTKISHQLKVR